MGEVDVPVDARWGASTQRAVQNFPISGQAIGRELIGALGRIKEAAAIVNGRLGVLDPDLAAAVAGAAREVAAGAWDAHFPVDVFQTGSGTSSNMNANEVIAGLAAERLDRLVHPNDHVNASQSSNDVFPSAVHLAATEAVATDLVPSLRHLADVLRRRQADTADVVKAGRTHLMDATPVTLGQELGGYASAIEHGIERLEDTLPRLGELALGGTAVGTGINAPPGFASAVIEALTAATGLPLREARDHFEAQGGRDALVEASGMVRTVAVSMIKMANDLRWMSSGPASGLAEIHLPDLQPGSSIMPGKVNPVIPEVVVQVGAQVVGNDAAVAFAGTTGSFELQRGRAGDGPQPVGVDPHPGRRRPGPGRPVRGRLPGRRGPVPALRGVVSRPRHRSRPPHRLRAVGGGRAPGPGRGPHPPGRRRRARPPARRRPRPGPRRRRHDPRRNHPLTCGFPHPTPLRRELCPAFTVLCSTGPRGEGGGVGK